MSTHPFRSTCQAPTPSFSLASFPGHYRFYLAAVKKNWFLFTGSCKVKCGLGTRQLFVTCSMEEDNFYHLQVFLASFPGSRAQEPGNEAKVFMLQVGTWEQGQFSSVLTKHSTHLSCIFATHPSIATTSSTWWRSTALWWLLGRQAAARPPRSEEKEAVIGSLLWEPSTPVSYLQTHPQYIYQRQSPVYRLGYWDSHQYITLVTEAVTNILPWSLRQSPIYRLGYWGNHQYITLVTEAVTNILPWLPRESPIYHLGYQGNHLGYLYGSLETWIQG